VKLSEIKQVLAERSIDLTRSLGQNFLHDGNQLRRILVAADLKESDQVLEIGPGLGPLTELLLQHSRSVRAIEKDARLVQYLRERFAGVDNLDLLHADALEYLRTPQDWGDWKIVSNLPYSVASPILVELAQAAVAPRVIVVTLQLEVARRIMAKAGDADYGILTLLLQLRFEPAGLFKIPGSCFFPAPEVESACLTLRRRPEPLLESARGALFKSIVKRAFSQRRKMMLKLLKADWPAEALETSFAELKLSPQCRAETVTLEQFVRLAERLAHTGRK
jgi:16S rRNA (adenine1518-N6/adenine1519-N6)-dimethyltransferase